MTLLLSHRNLELMNDAAAVCLLFTGVVRHFRCLSRRRRAERQRRAGV